MRVINIEQMLTHVDKPWTPHVVGRVNDALVKLAKLQGEFIWHQHETEDELFLVVRGTLRMGVREGGSEREEIVRPGELLIIPHGTEHRPVAGDGEEVHVLLFEPDTTVNTGDAGGERTVSELPSL
jgi:mannose-6-phosphate isomerase-like protein (cupin superfamily)